MNHPRVLPGPRSRLSVVLISVLVLLALLPWAPPATAADDDSDATPLSVRLTRMSSAVIPSKGDLVLSGTVTNDSDETWIAVNVHPFISASPMTTRDQLAAAAQSDPTSDVGRRLTKVGQFAAVGDLEPQQTASYSISLRVKDLPITRRQGVYWIGVHALGQNAQGRDTVADGRARTFIPLVNAKSVHTSIALVVPIRETVRRDRSGRLLDTSHWSDILSSTGRLGRIAGFLGSAGPHPLTMLVDPAVLDAVKDLADGNPALSFGTPLKATPSESPSPSRTGVRLEAGDGADASSWLSGFTVAARGHSVLGLGYADPDVAALVREGSPLRSLANRLAAQTFNDLRIPALPTVAPPGGWLSDDTLARLAPATTVLVSDHGAPQRRTVWQTPGGQDLVVTDESASSGGPGPTPPLDALALRQRILADAALRLAEHSPDPLVVQLPADWDPGAGWQLADFFDSLDQPWLNEVALGPNSVAGAPAFEASLNYPAAQGKLELPVENVTAARKLTQTTTALVQLLRSKNTVAHDLAGVALNSVSIHARGDEVDARVEVLDTNDRIRSRMGKVEVLGTDFVTLSGGSGTLAITLVNGLDQAIVVGVEPHASTSDVTVAASKPVTMAPGERTVLRLKANASSIGVARVVLTPVTEQGTELGTPLTFSLRTSQVGKTIWFVLIAGGVLLVVMVLRRVRRGLVEHRWKGRG